MKISHLISMLQRMEYSVKEKGFLEPEVGDSLLGLRYNKCNNRVEFITSKLNSSGVLPECTRFYVDELCKDPVKAREFLVRAKIIS